MGAAISAQGFTPTGQALPTATDGKPIASANWSDPVPIREGDLLHPLSCSTSFTLHPGSFTSADVGCFLIGRGTSSGGFVKVVEHERGDKDDSVKVEIEARLRDPDELGHVSVVALEKEDGSQGVGIYTLQRIHITQVPIIFHTTISFPRNGPKDQDVPSYSLRTSTSNTTYELDLPSVQLEHLALESSNKPIRTLSPLTSTSASLVTSNAKILGHFTASTFINAISSNGILDGDFTAPQFVSLSTSNAKVSGSFSTSSLTIKTSNHPIDLATIDLAHDSNSISLTTSNAPITASFKLHPSSSSTSSSSTAPVSTIDSDAPPSYEALASSSSSSTTQAPLSSSSSPTNSRQTIDSNITTSNAPLDITYDLSSSSSPVLRSSLKTSNAQVKLFHRGFEGTWEAKTSNAKISVEGSRAGGEGGGSTSGRIGEGDGNSSVTTSNAPVQIRFD